MRQHVNPLSNFFKDIKPIPPLNEIFLNPDKPLHIDIGSGSGEFLINLAMQNKYWNYLGLEIREKLVLNAKSKIDKESIENLFFVFGNANNLIEDCIGKFNKDVLKSVSFNFPDPWFKKRHHKRRVIQPELIDNISQLMTSGGLIYIKSDVAELFTYMDLSIIKSSDFISYNNKNNASSRCYNPNNSKTNREKYVIQRNLQIYERIYQKI